MTFRVNLSLFHKATGNNNPAHASKMNKSNTLRNTWDSACFVEEDEGMDWWDRWTAEDEAHALWAAEADADAYEVSLARSFTASDAVREAEEESQARIEELVAEWNSAMAMREAEEAAEPEAEVDGVMEDSEEWLWADEGKWLQAQAKMVLEMVLE